MMNTVKNTSEYVLIDVGQSGMIIITSSKTATFSAILAALGLMITLTEEVNIKSALADGSPITTLTINGERYVDSTGRTFVTSGSHFNLSVESSIPITETYYRYFKASDSTKPSFSSGTYFKISGSSGEYVVQFYSVDVNANKEPVRQNNVVLDNSDPTTSLSVIDSTAGKIRLTASDNSGGSGVGGRSNSGIYYKLDSAASYTFVKSKTVELTNVANAAHTIYYYSIDNLENKEDIKSKKFIVTYTSCSSGCKYTNLQTAIS